MRVIWHALATYRHEQGPKPALVLGTADRWQLYDLAQLHHLATGDSADPAWLSGGLLAALESWSEAGQRIRELTEQAHAFAQSGSLSPVPGALAKLTEPFRPPRVFAAASNYVEHAREMGTVLARKSESKPYIFIKASTAVIGPGETVYLPVETEKPDWEVELAAVIGRRARRVSKEQALEYVAGYTIMNDVSARDLTKRDDFPFKFDWFQGKSFDTFAPLGPWMIPSELIENPQELRLSLAVNDETMQDGTTAEMIFTVSEQISYLSTILTLMPGDVIATGTPTGVGAGRGIFLKPGDVMRASVEGIGTLENPVEAEIVG